MYMLPGIHNVHAPGHTQCTCSRAYTIRTLIIGLDNTMDIRLDGLKKRHTLVHYLCNRHKFPITSCDVLRSTCLVVNMLEHVSSSPCLRVDNLEHKKDVRSICPVSETMIR